MTASLFRIWAIALNTFREAARIKVLYAIVVVVVAVNLLAIALGEMSVSQHSRVARDFGIAGISLFGSLTAIFVGIVLLYGEIQKRTIYSIIPCRWRAGVRRRQVPGWCWCDRAGGGVRDRDGAVLAYQGVAISGAVGKALVLAWFEVLTVAAIAVFFSSFSSPFLSGTFALALWAIGRVTPDLRAAIASSESTWIKWVAKGALVIVPDLHVFSISGGDVDGQHVSVNGGFVDWGYVAAAAAHGALWIAALLVLACAIFRKRDFEAAGLAARGRRLPVAAAGAAGRAARRHRRRLSAPPPHAHLGMAGDTAAAAGRGAWVWQQSAAAPRSAARC
jgi:hypothetical protein